MKYAPRPIAVTAALAVGTLVITGAVVFFPPTVAPASASALPGSPETFDVSQSTGGESENAFMTADAQHVVYTSSATDQVPGDTNGQPDVFLSVAQAGSDPFAESPILVSAPDGPVGAARANSWSDDAVASADGRIVAFTSAATNLVGSPSTVGRRHIYVRDTVANTTFRIQGAAEPNGNSYSPDLSDDGRHLVFTSNADNFGSDDTNGAADAYVVDLNVDGNDTFGDYDVEKLYPSVQIPTGTHDVVISGNGYIVAFLSRVDPNLVSQTQTTDSLFTTTIGYYRSGRIADDVVSAPSIDATGKAFAYVRGGACDGADAVVAAMVASDMPYSVALGQINADTRSGWVADPQISADGSRVVWSTTVPDFDFDNGGVASPPLAEPMVRMQNVPWWDAGSTQVELECSGVSGDNEWFDVATGSEPSPSATGRTIAYQSPEPAHIYAIDTHSHEGISVSSTQGVVLVPSFVTEVPIAGLSVAALRNYAAALADAPVHRLPVHRLPVHRLPVHRLPVHRLLVEDSPVHRLPVHRLPVHRLPVHRLDIPGGWAQILENTPFADQLLESVTLDAVLAWAEAALADGSTANEAERKAAELIQSLTLEDIDIDGSGLDALSLASYVMGNAALADLPIDDGPSNIGSWQELADRQGLGVEVVGDTADEIGTVLADLDAAGLDIASTGIEAVVLSSLPQATIDRTMLGFMDIDPALLPGTPLGAIEVSSLTDSGKKALFGRTDVSGTLAEPSSPILASATFAELVKAGPDVTFGDVLFSVLDAESYPWEQIDPAAIDARGATETSTVGSCGGPNGRCTYDAPFRFSFDVGPGEAATFAVPVAEIDLPEGTVSTQVLVNAAGPGISLNSLYQYQGSYSTSGRRVSVPLADTQPGTVFEVDAWFSSRMTVGDAHATARLTTGSQTAEAELFGELELWGMGRAFAQPDSGRRMARTDRAGNGPARRQPVLRVDLARGAALQRRPRGRHPRPGRGRGLLPR